MTLYKNPQIFSVEGSDITATLINDIAEVLLNHFVQENIEIDVYNGEISSPDALLELQARVARGQLLLIKHEEVRHDDWDSRGTQVDESCYIGIYCCYGNYLDFDLTGTQTNTIFQAIRRVVGVILSTRFDIKPSGSGNSVKVQARPEGILEVVNAPGLIVERPLFSFRYSTDYSSFL